MRVRRFVAVACIAVAGCTARGLGIAPPPAVPTADARFVRFSTLPPGSTLPSDATCAARVQPRPENKGMNRRYNATPGRQTLGTHFFPSGSDDPRANSQIAVRVDGNFTGTTDEILQWVSCKWGMDTDLVRAQAAQESWWQQTTLGDWNTDPSYCAPGHGLGVDEPKRHPGQCPNSWGILQNKWFFEKPSWPGIRDSTAFNADTAYAIWRACYEGYVWWLRSQPAHSGYASGDVWGCVGSWYAGAWRTPPALTYIAGVRHYLRIKVWTKPYFQQP
ncbi:MAG: hypothetical protein JO277_03005 [Candidatus Eremiobacteraeota bacterium]|nr:hypothetical protein [Candidatus Eremiobacteraeota bacterium]